VLIQTATTKLNPSRLQFDTRFTDACIPEACMTRDRILIVEDEAIQAMCLQDKLTDLGYGVTAMVSNGEQAVQAAAEHHPDLVLMDIKLNGRIDGVEAARQIRQQSSIPVIFMSAYTDINTLQRAFLTGPSGYLVKPVRLEKLSQELARVLRH